MSANGSRVPAPAIATISSLESRLVRLKFLAAAVLGVCVGALVGGLSLAAMGTDTTATAFVRLENPADLTAIAAGASQVTPDNQGNTSYFVGGEIAYLSGEGFAQAVAKKMAMDEPAILNVAQAGDSSMVTISNSSKSRDDAIRTVQVAIDLYGQELAQRVDEQLRTILAALSRWEQTGAGDSVRMQELGRIRAAVELQASEASTLLIVQPPTPNDDASQQWLVGVLLGGLLGGSAAVAIVLMRRRRSGRAAMTVTLIDSVDDVLVPAVDLGAVSPDNRDGEQARLARTLYAQCPSRSRGGVVLVIGASPSSGSAEVASLLEVGAAEQAPSARVLHGGVVGDPTLAPDLIAAAAGIVLVARIDADTAAQAATLRSAIGDSQAPVVAAFTYHRPGGGAHWKKRQPEDSSRQGVDDAERSMQ
ncbi:hypothetical protein E4P42_07165 [Mycobacterium sp. PS03-16]|uniref:hypothetical protein n=1 Tax=Mycobacterium sp. PS03-16 TaxID=2559611 RepID=UPI0010749398|nr:hypothetical protein [Mycobacterium sp. PS03-16]TFV59669.1 hypothetical protein E4P42_07165 [Mycobacterium sp. PS03-16]